MDSSAFLAAAVIFLTTADDALWLIPVLTSKRFTVLARCLHAAAFIAALQCVVLVSGIGVDVFGAAVCSLTDLTRLDALAAVLAWAIAFYFYARAVLKRRRKERAKAEKAAAAAAAAAAAEAEAGMAAEAGTMGAVGGGGTSTAIAAAGAKSEYGAVPTLEEVYDDNEPTELKRGMMPCTVFGLAFLGALDELSYFPTLLLSGTFSIPQLALGAFLACSAILAVVTLFLVRCRPLLEFFDRIPLYVVVAAFAAVMTAEALLDGGSDGGDGSASSAAES